MAARPSWNGFLKLSLVSVPVKGLSANEPSERMTLNQLHAECFSRIRYVKTCPIHGEVTKDEIVSGYEHAKGEYVVIEPKELDEIRGKDARAINVDAILPAGTITPLYFSEKAYYLIPASEVGERPFALIRHCLAKDKLEAVARGVLFGREELVLVQPVENVLRLTALKYEAEVRQPSLVSDDIEPQELDKKEIELTSNLLKAFKRRDFKMSEYEDEYVKTLRTLIEAKVNGNEIAAPPAEDEGPRSLNLMDALRQSIARPRGSRGATGEKRKPTVRLPRKGGRARRKTG